MRDVAPTDPAVADVLLAYRYRKEFGLTYEQMQAEPLDQVNMVATIWEFERKRDKIETERAKQKRQSNGQ